MADAQLYYARGLLSSLDSAEGACGFSVRHWHMVEARRPSTVFTLLPLGDLLPVLQEADKALSAYRFGLIKTKNGDRAAAGQGQRFRFIAF
jgi:hypothetical protein